jgi:hypothetical protein
MAIRFFGEWHCDVVDLAHDALRNRLGRFTLGNLQGGGRSALFFIAACCVAILEIRGYRQFQESRS